MAVLAVAAIALLAVCTRRPVQTRILQWSIGELERRFDLDLTADSLSFNLVTLRVVMTNVRLAAVGHHDDPFFTAESVEVRLPWAVYRGRAELRRGGRRRRTRHDHARPVGRLEPAAGPRPPRSERAAAARRRPRRAASGSSTSSIAICSATSRSRRRASAPICPTLPATGATGPLAIDGTIAVRVKQRRVDVKPVSGTMVFDGSNVELEGITLDTTDGVFAMSGRITRALDHADARSARSTGTTEIAHVVALGAAADSRRRSGGDRRDDEGRADAVRARRARHLAGDRGRDRTRRGDRRGSPG